RKGESSDFPGFIFLLQSLENLFVVVAPGHGRGCEWSSLFGVWLEPGGEVRFDFHRAWFSGLCNRGWEVNFSRRQIDHVPVHTSSFGIADSGEKFHSPKRN